jgi:hypothetical protein
VHRGNLYLHYSSFKLILNNEPQLDQAMLAFTIAMVEVKKGLA